MVSLFIALSDPAIPTDTDDFYASLSRREQPHRRRLPPSGQAARLPWGSADVARDKSDNVFIYSA